MSPVIQRYRTGISTIGATVNALAQNMGLRRNPIHNISSQRKIWVEKFVTDNSSPSTNEAKPAIIMLLILIEVIHKLFFLSPAECDNFISQINLIVDNLADTPQVH